MKCEICQFWDECSSDSAIGTCKRNAPHVVVLDVKVDNPALQKFTTEKRATSVWPMTGKDDWCGEFKAKSAAEGC